MESSFGGDVEVLPRSGALRRLVIGGFPVEVEGQAVRVGSRSFAGSSVYPIPKGNGWRFVTAQGIWDADTFLGPPRLVAWSTRSRVGVGTGRLVEIEEGVIVGASLPEMVVIDAAFSDETRGVAIVEPGVALLTRDGGATWTPTRGMPDAMRGVVATVDRRWVFGERQALSIAPDGSATLVPVAAVPRITSVEEQPRELRDLRFGPVSATMTAQRLGIERFMAFADAARRRVVAERAPPGGGPRDLVEYDLVEERLVAELRPPEFCDHPGLVLGDALHLLCDRGGEGATLYRRGTSGGWEPRITVAPCGAPPRCVASPDGERVACTGRCDASERCGAGLTLCERDASGAHAARSVGDAADRWEPVGYDGDTLVLADARRALRHARVIVGASPPRPLVRGLDPESPWVIERRLFGRDGRVRMQLGRLDGSQREVWEGFAGEAFEALTTPPSLRVEDGTNVALCTGEGDLVAVARDGVPWVRVRGRSAWVEALPSHGELAFLRGVAMPEGRPECGELGFQFGVGWSNNLHTLGWGPLTAGARESLGVRSLWGRGDRPDPYLDCVSEEGVAGAPEHEPSGTTGPGVSGRLRPRASEPLYQHQAPVRVVEPQGSSGAPGAVTVSAATPGFVGFASLDGFRGYARIRADGSVLAGPLGALPRVVARATRWTPCAGSARGEFVFDADVYVDGQGARNAFGGVRMGIEGDALCVLGVVSLRGAWRVGAWRVGATANDATSTVRCERRPDREEP